MCRTVITVTFFLVSSYSRESLIALFVSKKSTRSSPPEVFLKKGFLKICSKFRGEHPCWSVISIKLRNFIKMALRHGCSPVSLLHIIRILLPKNTSGRLLLEYPVIFLDGLSPAHFLLVLMNLLYQEVLERSINKVFIKRHCWTSLYFWSVVFLFHI